MPTNRAFKRKTFNCGHYEAQDVLAEIDDVDLIYLEPLKGYDFRESWQRRLLYRDITKRLIFRNPGLKKVRLTQDYDVFLAVCQTHHDILSINAVENWKDRCRTSILWIDELWTATLPRFKYWIHYFKQFDHVFVGYKGTAEPLSKILGRPCHWLPGGVDALRFTPYPNCPVRSVDVFSIGRRWEGIHKALLSLSLNRDIFYVYDTAQGSFLDVFDHREHRWMFANMAKRSKYFVVQPGKMDATDERQGQVEIGFRYYEAAAAGAVMIGQAPKCDSYPEMFPWEAVLEIDPDGSDVVSTLRELERDPERTARIRRDNAVGALLNHDWSYRWKQLLETAGISPSPRMPERKRQLKELAAQAGSTTLSSAMAEC